MMCVLFVACNTHQQGETTNTEDPTPTVDSEEVMTIDSMQDQSDIIPKEYSSVGTGQTDDDYQVVLSVDTNFVWGETGEFVVWIGDQENTPNFSERQEQDQTTAPKDITKYVTVEPNAPEFEIIGRPVHDCMLVHPSGSSFTFNLKAKSTGKHRVGANIYLYDNGDCTGTPIPKAVRSLEVEVKIDAKKEVKEGIAELAGETWSKFKVFWGSLLTLIFGALLFVVRRYIKNRTGYTDPNAKEEKS